MEKTYAPHLIEQRWYEAWEKAGYFAAKTSGESYCIMIPPPNVTGNLHMGHAFQDTLMDTLVRYHRMQGYSTLWQPGTDHAGIATQMVVERLINAEGKTRHDYGREKFVEKVWDWKERSGGTITRQLRRMGASLDWEKERFTMDRGMSDAVQEVFIRLYEEGLIYRGKRLVNWDTVLHTAVSDLEVLATEEAGFMWHLRYPLSNRSDHLIVATTRPETLLGDAAVAVHPDDERYQHLVGEFVSLPLTDRRIPIIADQHVDPEFGTGCVKITPAHDFNDYEVWTRHKSLPAMQALPAHGLITIFTTAGAIRANEKDTPVVIPEQYVGLDRFVARKQMIADLDQQGLLAKTVKHKLMVPRGDRSHSIIEPLLTNQWYVKVESLAGPAIQAVENGDIRFVPDNWKNTYFEWMRNIQDWCISRQIWWGHRIPAWYDPAGNVYVGSCEQAVRKKYALPDSCLLSQDEDVLDTWFSSALWPFSTLGWPKKTPALDLHYPTSVLVTGFDIIFFWVARMIMMGLKFQGKVPFKEIYIHGLVRDAEGQKMSKSKGNVLDPIDLIDGIALDALIKKRLAEVMQPHLQKKIEATTRQHFPTGIPAFGTDALRFTFASLASTGRDIRFDLARAEGYRNFCNKLWNAARYVLLNTQNQACGLTDTAIEYADADWWIRARLKQAIVATREALENYRFDLAAQTLYEFIWDDYCCWYLELAKISLQTDNEALQQGTRQTLVQVLADILRLSHPLIPFITEEIWQHVAPLAGINAGTIMLQPYPQANNKQTNPAAIQSTEWVMEFILGVRRIRGEMTIAPGKPLPVLLANVTATDETLLARNQHYLLKLGRLLSITQLNPTETAPESAIALVGKMQILIPMAGLIDKTAELTRLNKEIQKIAHARPRIEGKLNNPTFISKAPASVIAKEKEKLAVLLASQNSLLQQLDKIKSL